MVTTHLQFTCLRDTSFMTYESYDQFLCFAIVWHARFVS